MAEGKEYRFHIDVFTPDTLSMARLCEYLSELSILLGNRESVHFMRVEESESSNLAYKIDLPAVPRTQHRLQLVKSRSLDAPPEAVKAFDAINSKLVEDGTSASIEPEDDPSPVIIFPGRSALVSGQLSEGFGPIIEPGSIDGQIVRVGGFDKTIPVHMRSDTVHHYCNADEDMARKLGPHVLGKPIRVFGEGKWYRDEAGQWKRKLFTITDFKVLEDVTLMESIARLRSVQSPLGKMADPLAALHLIRHGPEGIGSE